MGMSQEPRPWAWLMDLTPGAAHEVRALLVKAQLTTDWGKGGLKVGPGAYPKQVAVVMDDPATELDAEGNALLLEKAEVVLREAGYGMYLTRRVAEDGHYQTPYLRVLGRSAEGPGPRTVRQSVKVEAGTPDLPEGIG